MSNIKYNIIQEVLSKLHNHNDNSVLPDIDHYVNSSFQTKRSGTSLRLTPFGKYLFEHCGIEYYKFEFTKKYTGLEFESITRKLANIKCPFFIDSFFIDDYTYSSYSAKLMLIVYNGKIATMIGLYGTVDEYLESIK